ncbi:MAG: M23 family metallopeptidase [Dokdonella sp.]|nr:M23 family metallopeptidase [Dokdonella sp.]
MRSSEAAGSGIVVGIPDVRRRRPRHARTKGGRVAARPRVNNSLDRDCAQVLVSIRVDATCARPLWYGAIGRSREPVNDSAAPHPTPHRYRRATIRRHLQRRYFRLYQRVSRWTFLPAPSRWRPGHWILGGVVVIVCALVGVIAPGFANATRHEAMPLTTLALELPPLPADAAIGAYAHTSGPDWRIVTVRPGQTLSDIFREQGFAPADLQRALDSQADATALRRIRPGQVFEFTTDATGTLAAMRFERGDATRVVLQFDAGKVSEQVEDRAVERRVHIAHGVVTRSLFYAGERAGLSDAMVLKLADAFGYDIDFAQDLREGDSFSVVYDDLYRDGELLRGGDIIAATFINDGKRYTAVRYVNARGESMFYSEDGRPLRKSFLRTPVEFTRISSLFSTGRMHPILGKMRAHKGVDYAAPSGTPIRAAGDGKIVFRGWKSGYGNFVMIQHNAHITTAYGHMSRFAKVKVGQHVAQGQVIGYVGMTGLATGPHLHYEFRVDGGHRNPLKVTLPPPEPLPAAELAQFKAATAPMLAKLKLADGIQLAHAGR